jgi:hypothetical protein
MTKARNIASLLSTANGKIAGNNLDVSFENIADTGTEGTKVATGTTAQRGSTTGQLRFNSDTGLAEYYDGSQFKSIDSPPTISSISPTSLGESVLGSSQTIVITGSNFSNTVTAKIVGNDETEYSPVSTTRDSNTQVTITTPTNLTASNEPYDIVVTNTSGLTATLADALSINDTPVFSTASGSLGTLAFDGREASNLTAISFSDEESTPTVSVTSGSIPTGLTLNSNGTWTGTANAETSTQTYNFTVTATDGSESATRNYSITVNAPLNIEYLVVAGGGAGGGTDPYGSTDGGGGGAGGMLTGTYSAVSIGTVITASVGGGVTGTLADRVSGNNSQLSGSGLSTILCYGGGGGGATNSQAGASGGSGGGASDANSAGGGGSGTVGQGNSGGNAGASGAFGGGAGGGKGALGTDGNSTNGGTGGNGLASSITGSSITYAGGGGGGCFGGTAGAGGSGGGGAGSDGNFDGIAGGTNLGGGGGGGSTQDGYKGGNGGSGIIILKVPTSSYSSTTTGSPTILDSGSFKIIKFTGSGSYTA